MPTRKKFLLRISSDLWDELNRWAGDELRSVNSQIEYLLRQAVRQRGRTLEESPEDTEGTDEGDNSSDQ
jgi:hypothetical protein